MKSDFNKLFKAFFLSIVLISIFFFISERQCYHPQIMPFVGSIAEPFRGEGIHVCAKAYSSHESEAYLSRDLTQRGFQPVQVTIQNNTAKTYFLSKKGIDVSNASTGQVAFSVSRNAIPRSIAFKVAGFLFWPFLIPGTIDSIVSFRSHFKMTKDYQAKSIKDEREPLMPYSTMHRILFIPKQQYVDEFSLFLQEQQSGKYYPFQVKIYS